MDRLELINIEKEVKDSFLQYSMSVIVSRALPDLRDGLKPVHRRILYAMYEDKYTPDKQYVKSAKTVGNVMGKYHPHGDSAIYDSMVRMAQDFSYRHTLVDGHGNFGFIDGSTAAASRYTESRLSKISMEMLRDIDKKTIDMVANYDASEEEPTVLPSRYPNILVNGTTGIAVGMATNIPPHNLGEVIDACAAYIDNHDIDLDGLLEHIKGPDFPTGGSILGNSGIRKAYETGKGSIVIRGKVDIVEKNGKTQIVITEVPYQTNTSNLQLRIAELVRDKVLTGIADLRDETSLKNGFKLVVEIKKEANASVILNNLYKHTQLQTSYGINLLMLHNGRPHTFGLQEIIKHYIDFQKEIIFRRTRHNLNKAEERFHILSGLKIALDHIDEVIKIIRESKTDSIAREELISRFSLDKIQAESILEMKLRRLTGLEKDKIINELEQLSILIADLKDILSSEDRVYQIIKEEMLEIKRKFSNDRRTIIDMTAIEFIEDESLIPVENIMITLTNKGYIKRITTETYRTQNRGGVGVKGMATNEEDFVEKMITMTTHDYILFFSNKGRVYRIKGYEVPLYSRQAKGLPIINLLPLEPEETITSMLMVENKDQSPYIVFCTQNGLVKRTELKEFDRIRTSGKIAITLKEDDSLIGVKKTNGDNEILIASSNGRMIRFNEKEIRVMGRTASGVKGIDIDSGKCVGMEVTSENNEVLVITENGFGKKTDIEQYRKTHRGSKGVKALNVTEKNGNIVTFKIVSGNEDLMIMTNNGIIIRVSLEQVSSTGRVAQGVKIINLKDNQKVSTIALVEKATIEEEIITEI
ncbi:MAG: DNA gyrase subunit A [Mycoplasmatota bacterium]